VKLVRHKVEPRDPIPAAYKMDQVTTLDGVQVIYAGTVRMCGAIVDAEFVQSGDKIYRLERWPKYSGVRIDACDCYFPPFRCGGAVPASLDLLYELPSLATYAGRIKVEYDARDPAIHGGASGKACMPPPPPP
jgi:hypothetical protein